MTAAPLANPGQISLRGYVAEALWPKAGYARLFLALVVVNAFSYWVVSQWMYRHQPQSVIAIYRQALPIGDRGYFPIISALSRLNFGERGVLEHAGHGIASFAFPAILPQAVLFRVFGLPGLVLADILIALAYYAALAVLLRILGISEAVAYCVSLMIVCGVWRFLLYAAPSLPLDFWDWRFPRPIVTDLFLKICLVLIFAILNFDANCRRWWCALGASFAALVQGELHLAVSVAELVGFLFVYLVMRDFRRPGQWAGLAKGSAAMIAGGAIAGWPFLLQRLYENKDAARRLGMIVLPRTRLVLLPHPILYVEVIVVVVLALLDLGLLQRLELPGVARVMRQRNIVMLAMFAVAGILALPLFVLVMGKGIQLFHFGFAVTRICSLVLLILGIYLATDLCRLLPGVSRKARVGPGEGGKMWVNAAACAIMCISLAVSVERAYKKARGDLDANWEMPDAADQHDYRSRFADLVRELSSAKYDGAPVIGTFDYQVYCWWLTFRNGYALMPDPFYTTITDGEIEQRMILMCRLLGMNADQFWALISQVNPDVLWLAHWKYNVSNGYTLRPLEDYPSEAIPAIQRTSIATMERLLYVIPNSEKRRLMAEFDAPAPAGAVPRLDLIVLTNGPEYRGFAPPAGEYQKTYENTMFRVFERIPGKGQAN